MENKKKILLVDGTFPINTRNDRILNSLYKIFSGLSINVAVWNRDGRSKEKAKDIRFTHYYHNELAAYGNPLKKLLKLYSFYRFLKKINQSENFDVIIASHWDILFLSSLIKKKQQVLIYENLDVPTAKLSMVVKSISLIEKFALKKVEVMILASRFFEGLYAQFNIKKIILENLPSKELLHNPPHLIYRGDNNKLKVSFLGTIRYFEILRNLIDASSELPVEILLWGEGPDLQKLREYSQGKQHVKIFGKYNYEEIGDMYEASDVIWAVYPSKDFNVNYAISNKFHECIVFNKPGVFAEDTKLGDLVESRNLGYTVDPYSILEIKKLFQNILENKPIKKEAFEAYKENNAIYWEENEVLLKKIFTDILKGDK